MKKDKFGLFRVLAIYIPLAVYLIFLLFPFYWTFVTSIKP